MTLTRRADALPHDTASAALTTPSASLYTASLDLFASLPHGLTAAVETALTMPARQLAVSSTACEDAANKSSSRKPCKCKGDVVVMDTVCH